MSLWEEFKAIASYAEETGELPVMAGALIVLLTIGLIGYAIALA